MGKIDEPEYAVNHGVAYGYEGIKASQGESVEKVLDEHGQCHVSTPLKLIKVKRELNTPSLPFVRHLLLKVYLLVGKEEL